MTLQLLLALEAINHFIKKGHDMKRMATFSEVEALQALCRNNLNWTDGGYWMGAGPDPDCFGSKVLSHSSHKTILMFNSDKAVADWNEGLNNNHQNTLFVIGLVTAVITTNIASKMANYILGIAGAGISYLKPKLPIVARGDQVETIESFSLIVSSSVSSSFLKTLTVEVFGPTKIKKYSEKFSVSYPVQSQSVQSAFSKISSKKSSLRVIVL
jgi:hypothetical protein